MRGRYPAGLEYVEHFNASEQAKRRFQVTVQLLAGHCRVGEACALLGIGSTRLEQVRQEIVAAALAGAERQRPGRKRRAVPALEGEVERLRLRVAQLEAALQAATVRAEVAAALPRVGAGQAEEPGKKTTIRRRGRRRVTPRS